MREPHHNPQCLAASGPLILICGDLIRPGLAWMLTRTHRYLATAMAQLRDPDGFARLHQLAQAWQEGARLDARIAATLLACKGGTIAEITVGDCVELVDTQRRVHVRGGQKKVDFYLRLYALGVFPDDAPHTIRAFGLAASAARNLLELSHPSITEYRRPSTGELVPLLQIAPSKTDTERLVSPELADVLSAIVSRIRKPEGVIPLIASYDTRERLWNPPMPLLFQRSIGTENRAYTPTAIRKLLIRALAATSLTTVDGDAAVFSPARLS
jgi:hypothetical protein